jgi:hypothetical protein
MSQNLGTMALKVSIFFSLLLPRRNLRKTGRGVGNPAWKGLYNIESTERYIIGVILQLPGFLLRSRSAYSRVKLELEMEL